MKHKDIEFDIKVNVTEIEVNEKGGFKFKIYYSVNGENVGEHITEISDDEAFGINNAKDCIEDLISNGGIIEIAIGNMELEIDDSKIKEIIKL